MLHLRFIISFFFLSFSHSSMTLAQTQLSNKSKAPIFEAAGFKNRHGTWQSKCSFGALTVYRDLNGDRIPDAIIKDGGSGCYPKAGMGFYLVSQRANHTWHLMLHKPGEAKFLTTKGVQGWPDIQVVDKSKCQSIYRWNGKQYVLNRSVSNNMPCKTNQPNKTLAKTVKPATVKSTDVVAKKPVKKPKVSTDIKQLNQSISQERINMEMSGTTKQNTPPQKPEYQPPAIDVATFKQYEEPSKSTKSLEDEIRIYKAFENLE